MTLAEMSGQYAQSAALLRQKLHQLRFALRNQTDPEEKWHLQRRIEALRPMLTEMNELAELTAHYYDRGYYRNEKYTLQRIGGSASARSGAAAAGASCYGELSE